MGTHLIPREIDGDARILIIFTGKGFIGTIIGIFLGAILFSFASAVGATLVGWVLLGICAIIGFVIGQVKIPDSSNFPLFKKVGGEYVRDIIVKYFAFKQRRKLYLYDQTDYGSGAENKEDTTIDAGPMLLNLKKK